MEEEFFSLYLFWENRMNLFLKIFSQTIFFGGRLFLLKLILNESHSFYFKLKKKLIFKAQD